MNLNEMLESVAAQIHADSEQLIAFAEEDSTLGGYHWNASLATFKQGSCFGVEGQTLYALIRWLKPDVVAEIGGWAGCSGSHIAAALIKNGKGKLYSVDNEVGGQPHGVDMPRSYRDVVTLVRANGQDWLAEQEDGSIGLIFEDADHSADLVALLSKLAYDKLQVGGILVNHDAMHDFSYDGNGNAVPDNSVVKNGIGHSVGREVRDGLNIANVYYRTYRAEPSDCGLAITVKPSSKKVLTDNLGQPYDEKRLKMFGEIANPYEPQSESAKMSIGNANIESVSEPPPVVKQTRNRKPKAK